MVLNLYLAKEWDGNLKFGIGIIFRIVGLIYGERILKYVKYYLEGPVNLKCGHWCHFFWLGLN